MPTIRGFSGGDVFVERLAAGLRDRGITVTVEWFNRRYEFAPGLLAGRAAPNGATIIHANGLDGFAFGKHGLPLVVTEHHYVLDPAYRPFKSPMQAVYHRLVTGRASLRSVRAATAVTTHSRFVATTVVAACPKVRPVVIPLWVDLRLFSPAMPSDRPAGPLRLLFVGNTSRRKGFDVVMALARRMGDAVEIACTGGLRGGTGGNLPSNVRFLGRLSSEDLVRAYQGCDAALVPSRYEGFGYAALEAMACGKPVLGFACGSVEEIVVDGESGFLVGVDDIDGLQRRAEELANDDGLRDAMGRSGRGRAERHFTVEQGVDAYIRLYASLVSP
jgi:glycosyltransferase involved in cell wall biosynthesis